MGNTLGDEASSAAPDIDSGVNSNINDEDENMGIGYKNTISSSQSNTSQLDYQESHEGRMTNENYGNTNNEIDPDVCRLETETNSLKCVFSAICDFFDLEESKRPEFENILYRKRIRVQRGEFVSETVLLDTTKEMDTSYGCLYVINTGQVNVVNVTNGSTMVISNRGQHVCNVDKYLQTREITIKTVMNSSLWYISLGEMIKIQYIYNLFRKNDDDSQVSHGSNSQSIDGDNKRVTSSPLFSISTKKSMSPSSSSSTLLQLRRVSTVSNDAINELDGNFNAIRAINNAKNKVTLNPTVQVILMATKEEYATWGVKSDVWYNEKDYARFRSERSIAALMGEDDIYFGARGVMVTKVDGCNQAATTVFGKHELDDTLSRATRI